MSKSAISVLITFVLLFAADPVLACTTFCLKNKGEVLFGKKRIPDRAWKTHDLRNRTIRLVQSGLALMRGGYRELMRPWRKDK